MRIYRILAVSDTHVPTIAQTLPEKILEEAHQSEIIIHAGDIVSRETLDSLAVERPVQA